MRSVLVCVRTPLAAQHLTSAAARLGLSGVVRTAVSDPEVMLRLAERPVDVVLADTALTRPDSAGFVRRVLARAPQAAVLLLGAEESESAAATISAGARGLIQNADHDLTSAVAKALLLLSAPGRSNRHRVADTARDAAAVGGPARSAGRTPGGPGWPAVAPVDAAGLPTVVPVQRGEDAEDPAAADAAEAARPGAGQRPARTPRGAIGLTERELQVLLGMAEGKSNAEIGRELFVSEDTVKTHARRLFRKLGARDRAHAVAAGFRAGLVA
ncbi:MULTISPECIES: helix-turn-helix transcriptional regulator [Micromonospora]|uniref:helix-turn-helix transcriptional regulator n=1 Tax=Micromonospora TaxID=1873 RepID=UPI00140C5F44|nr:MULTISPECIES: response regulator transcription factor [unclassified Micromonospora]MBP1785607.1 DNA-binding NarL/FixJ family response regulator [Micromonospora sp. HB375]MBQ1065943.1 response regulator transcription factor [Micromonospora sp. D75]MDH6467392.1 DNA-binding NarL/FixJ family response regulator [Micromonospora sp. H404/HB375]NHO83015.1 response regulator transcription factor [Micromonospora sp. CMU55-4]WBB85449.1 response regulator transcription factor [Micromonospora sp. WMMC26